MFKTRVGEVDLSIPRLREGSYPDGQSSRAALLLPALPKAGPRSGRGSGVSWGWMRHIHLVYELPSEDVFELQLGLCVARIIRAQESTIHSPREQSGLGSFHHQLSHQVISELKSIPLDSPALFRFVHQHEVRHLDGSHVFGRSKLLRDLAQSLPD